MNVILDLDSHSSYRGQSVLTDWLDALGVGAKDVRRIRVHEDEAGQRTVEITQLARNEHGHIYAVGDQAAENPPFTVPLSAPIPDQILALHRVPADAPPSLP